MQHCVGKNSSKIAHSLHKIHLIVWWEKFHTIAIKVIVYHTQQVMAPDFNKVSVNNHDGCCVDDGGKQTFSSSGRLHPECHSWSLREQLAG